MQPEGWIEAVKGRGRTLHGPFAVVYTLAAAAFGLWYLYTSGFGLVSTETNRGFYLMFTSVLVFLLYPARRGAPKDRPSLFDVLWVVLAVASVGYWIDQYTDYAINRVSDPNRWDFAMGLVAIAVMLETSRRVLGHVIVAIALLFWRSFTSALICRESSRTRAWASSASSSSPSRPRKRCSAW